MLGNSSAYTGTLTVYPDSALQVEGKLGGTVETSVRTVLSGTGTLNNVVLTSGMLAPGNAARPMGTMKLRGDLSFGQYASYRVAASPDGQHSSVRWAARPRWPAPWCTWAPTAATPRPPPTPS